MMNKEFSFSYLIRSLLRSWYWIIGLAVVFSVAAFMIQKYTFKATYTVSTNVIVRHTNVSAGNKYDQFTEDANQMNTNAVLAADTSNLEKVQKKLKDNDSVSMSLKQLERKVNVVPHPSSVILNIAATTSNAYTATKIVNYLAETYTKKYNSKKDNYEVRQVSRAKESTAQKSTYDRFQDAKKYGIIGALLGCIIGLFRGVAINRRNRGTEIR